MSDVCKNTIHGGCLGHMWDLTFVFVISKGMEYSLPYYHFQDPMSSTPLNLPFFIDVIKMWWEHEDTLHVDHFYIFLHFHSTLVDAQNYRPHIVDFYI